ncbi:interleukin 17-like protein [Mercenaria mercenaria]|uniref:interleukin 17-like protein n=1 Tax=Mercenaria mercenaria TaxID=6596 RepID=UPI00234E4F0C|nr:interleukin 17-like protein [Mercenaria mercenaria]
MFILKYILIVFAIGKAQLTTISACTDPNNLSLELANALYDLYTDERFVNFSLNIIPCLTSNNIIRNSPERSQEDAQNQAPAGSCLIPQNGGSVITDDGNNNREMCPWSFVIDYDNNRIPKQLAKAVCQCAHCHRGSCRPINSYIPILRKECDLNSGKYVFSKYIEEVPVGCRCIRARRAVQGDIFRHYAIRTLE